MADGSSFDLSADVVELAPYLPSAAASQLREVAFRADAWLADEIADLRRQFSADTPINTIAESLDRGVHGVRAKIYELGLRRNSTRPWSEWEEAELVARYGRESAATLAQNLGRGVAAVYARASLLGLQDEGKAPYTPWEDAQIRIGYQIGVPVAQIAAMIGRPTSGLVTHAWRSLNLRHANQPADWTEAEMARALELANEGHRYLTIIEMLVAEGYPRRTKNGFGQRLRILGYGRGWGKDWTPDEDELLRRAYATNESVAQLGSRLGRSRHSMKWRAEVLGLQGTHANRNGFRQGPDWTEEETAKLIAGYGNGRVAALAKEIGRPLRAVYQKAHHLGLKNEWCRDFTPDEDLAIGVAWRRGLALRDLAHAMDRDQAVVSKHAIQIGFQFSDPARPAKPSRKTKTSRPTLAEILALESLRPTPTPALQRALPDDREARRLSLRPRELRRVRRQLRGARA